MGKGFKTGGREKGTPNKLTEKVREVIYSVLEDYYTNTLKDDLKALTPPERAKLMMNLSEFAIPKMQRIETKIEDSTDKIIVVRYTPVSKEMQSQKVKSLKPAGNE